MTSSRLPGKVLRPLLGKPMLEMLMERVRGAWRLDRIGMATTINATDDPIESLARRLDMGCFRGSEEDALERVLQAARAERAEVIVELTGDCPLPDPGVIDATTGVHIEGDYVDVIGYGVLKEEYERRGNP